MLIASQLKMPDPQHLHLKGFRGVGKISSSQGLEIHCLSVRIGNSDLVRGSILNLEEGLRSLPLSHVQVYSEVSSSDCKCA